MNKELTPLDALKSIRCALSLGLDDKHCNYEKYNNLCDIIETALKDYEMEHTLRIRLENINYELVREKQDNDKKLKALEIIKEKKVDTLLLFRCFELDNLYGHSHLETYNQELYTQNITQEEYDLLKEILCH